VAVELKDCPHCGGESETMTTDENARTVRCMTPGCINEVGGGRIYRTIVDAVAAWNIRADTLPDDVVDLIIVWEWIRKHGGDINCTSTTRQHSVLLGVRHIFICEFKEFDSLSSAAEWIRERLGKYDDL
jgi:hypothetical protein